MLRLQDTLLSTLAAAACALGCAAGAVAAGGVADPAIDRWIASHARKLRGAEHAAARYAVRGDVDGDGRSDVAVLYTLLGAGQGGNALRYLAVFRRGPRLLEYRAHALVGGGGLREVNRVTILRRVIEIEALEYRPGDAACCPTRFVRHRYRLNGHRLQRAAAAAPQAGPDAKYSAPGRQ